MRNIPSLLEQLDHLFQIFIFFATIVAGYFASKAYRTTQEQLILQREENAFQDFKSMFSPSKMQGYEIMLQCLKYISYFRDEQIKLRVAFYLGESYIKNFKKRIERLRKYDELGGKKITFDGKKISSKLMLVKYEEAYEHYTKSPLPDISVFED